jgi:hypothetical protein
MLKFKRWSRSIKPQPKSHNFGSLPYLFVCVCRFYYVITNTTKLPLDQALDPPAYPSQLKLDDELNRCRGSSIQTLEMPTQSSSQPGRVKSMHTRATDHRQRSPQPRTGINRCMHDLVHGAQGCFTIEMVRVGVIKSAHGVPGGGG